MRDGINAYDAVQVRVDFDNGMSINFHNNWITPADFEGPVNQGHEIVGADGKVESDQQYRGFRWWNDGGGSRTSNNHFTRDVLRADGTRAYVGYGVDSLTVALVGDVPGEIRRRDAATPWRACIRPPRKRASPAPSSTRPRRCAI